MKKIRIMKKLLTILTPILTIAATILSATLTTQLMIQISAETGDKCTLPTLGVFLDLLKSISPLIIIFLWSQGRKWSAFFAAVLALLLTALSFSASFSALNNGVTAAQKNSHEYQLLQRQIDDYQIQIDMKLDLAKQFASFDRVTKANANTDEANELLAKVSELRAQQADLGASDSYFAKYGRYVALFASGCLELASWVLMILSYSLNPSSLSLITSKNSKSTDEKGTLTQSCTVDGHMASSALNASESQSNHTTQSCTVDGHMISSALNASDSQSNHATQSHTTEGANDESSESVCTEEEGDEHSHRQVIKNKIKKAIINQKCKPSIRGVQDLFSGVSRDEIRLVQEELKGAGMLEDYRGGYRLVA
ncbi:hypothetical protein P3552_21935 [Vibrio parahaemolyticus]|nr:hypothetical protein [Vibrio parahaemolyticus]MDF4729814.1 hypothetical protein [Vibrio parahaemolyticus]